MDTELMILFIIWIILSSILVIQYYPIIIKLSIPRQVAVLVILTVGATAVAITTIFEIILDLIVPQDLWDDDE